MTDSYIFQLIAENDLTPDHHQRISQLLVKSFPDSEAIFSQASYCYSLPEYRLIMEDQDGQLIAHLDLDRRMIAVNYVDMYVAGIGDVATHSDYQRRGIGTQLMLKLATILRDDLPADFGFLQCDEVTEQFYLKVGWHRITQPLAMIYKGEHIISDGMAMILPVHKTFAEWKTGGTVDLRGQPW